MRDFLRAALACLVLGLLLDAPVARAVQPDEILPDAALEQRAREISAGLRCLVCQNQSIDDSDAPLAKDLRVLVRERLKAGDSDADVEEFLVARYGEFVLLRPRLTLSTVLLWLLPPLVLVLAVWYVWRAAKTRPAAGALDAAPLTAEEKARLAAIVATRDDVNP